MTDGGYQQYINNERVISLLSDLVKIHSPYFHEEEIMEYVYNWLRERELPAEYHEFYEGRVTNFRGKNVIGRLTGVDEGPTVVLNGHLDTVNICEGWTRDPLGAEIEDGKMYGLGTLDMKGGDVAIMLAVEAFKNTVDEFNGEILYTFVSDEEGPYGLGTDALLLDGITDNADVAIVPEPSSGFAAIDFPCLCLGARGGWKYTVRLTGKSAHGANPEKGINQCKYKCRNSSIHHTFNMIKQISFTNSRSQIGGIRSRNTKTGTNTHHGHINK